jgi:hypothetical protein
MAFRNFKNIESMAIIEENGEFKYLCEFGVIRPFILKIIPKEEIQIAIQYIKNYAKIYENYKIKKEVLVFE